MSAIDFYDWGLPSKGAYLNSFAEDHLRNSANKLWQMIDSGALFFIMVFVVVALMGAILYYYPYNNKAGRHYKMRYWALWLVITALVAFAISAIMGFVLIDSPMKKDTTSFIMRISAINLVYSVLLYIIFSIIICNLNMPKTNAYRFFKIGK